MNKQAKIAAAQAILSKPNQSTSAQMAALAVLRNAQPHLQPSPPARNPIPKASALAWCTSI
jgi:hypothetical protein